MKCHRTWIVCLTVLAVAVLGGCAFTVQHKMADAVEEQSPSVAAALREKTTTVTEVDASALGEWQIVDVTARTPSHPQRWFMGVRQGGREVVVINDSPGQWDKILDGAVVSDSDQAIQLAEVYADATRNMSKTYSRVESIEDIPFFSKPGAEPRMRIDEIRADFADRISPATATGNGPWTVELYTVTHTSLVRHEVEVARDGSIKDRPVVEAEGLPVPVAP